MLLELPKGQHDFCECKSTLGNMVISICYSFWDNLPQYPSVTSKLLGASRHGAPSSFTGSLSFSFPSSLSLFQTHTFFLLAFSFRRRLKGPKNKRGLPSSMDGVLYLPSNLFRWLIIIFNLWNGNLGFKRLISFLSFLPLLNIGPSYELRESEKYPEQILLTMLLCSAPGRHMIV